LLPSRYCCNCCVILDYSSASLIKHWPHLLLCMSIYFGGIPLIVPSLFHLLLYSSTTWFTSFRNSFAVFITLSLNTAALHCRARSWRNSSCEIRVIRSCWSLGLPYNVAMRKIVPSTSYQIMIPSFIIIVSH